MTASFFPLKLQPLKRELHIHMGYAYCTCVELGKVMWEMCINHLVGETHFYIKMSMQGTWILEVTINEQEGSNC